MFVVVYQRFARWTARQQCVTNSWTSLRLIFAKRAIPGMMNVDEPKCLMMCLQLGCNQFSARHPTRVAENCFRFLISFWFLLYVKICRRFWQCFLVFYAFVRLFWWFGAWRDFQAETNQQVLVISVLYRANVKVMTQGSLMCTLGGWLYTKSIITTLPSCFHPSYGQSESPFLWVAPVSILKSEALPVYA